MTTVENQETREPLDAVQRARARALGVAREALAARAPMTSGTVDAADLVTVATWIITGHHPWGTEQSQPDQADYATEGPF